MGKVISGAVRVSAKAYKCRACGHVQTISTNHTGACFNYCDACSWKMNYCAPELCVPMFGQMYRPFDCAEVAA